MTRASFALTGFSASLLLAMNASAQMTTPADGEMLPAGHPDISSMMQGAAAPEPATTGRLAIQARQGTLGGPSIAGAEVTVELIHRGMSLETLDATLDEHGVVMFEDLAVGMGIQPIVTIKHAGVTYGQSGTIMDAEHPHQKVEIFCYEVTDDIPDWNIVMRHLMLSPAEEGVRVTELMVLNSSGNRTWLGASAEDGAKTIMELALTEGARDVELGRGFSGWSDAAFEGGKLAFRRPLVPGRTEFQFSYIVPATEDSATIDIVAPATVERMMVILPEGMSADATDSLKDGGTQAMGGKPVRFYVASDLPAEAAASLSVSSVTAPGPAAPNDAAAVVPESPAATSGSVAKLVAALGGGTLLLLAVGIIFFRSSPRGSGG